MLGRKVDVVDVSTNHWSLLTQDSVSSHSLEVSESLLFSLSDQPHVVPLLLPHPHDLVHLLQHPISPGLLSTNQRLVLFCVNQSEISIIPVDQLWVHRHRDPWDPDEEVANAELRAEHDDHREESDSQSAVVVEQEPPGEHQEQQHPPHRGRHPQQGYLQH